jgi:UDP-2,3-diacylglucosamine hydrolase
LPESLFISDLHLSAERPLALRLFLRFLQERAVLAERLYILGDLFDAWIGDDDPSTPAPEVIAGLRGLTEAGVTVYLQRGNRDFLLGRRFCGATGCGLLKDPVRVDLYGVPTLLMHGDLLCTDDHDYQRVRRRLRNPLVQWLFLRKPLEHRRALAADYRRRSGQATSMKRTEIMDVSPHTVRRYMQRHNVSRLIHGHTHRPAIHHIELAGRSTDRIVLGDWRDHCAPYVKITPAGCEPLLFGLTPSPHQLHTPIVERPSP